MPTTPYWTRVGESMTNWLPCIGVATIICVSGITAASPDERAKEDSEPPLAREIVSRAFANLYGFSSIQDITITAGAADQRFERSAQVVRQSASTGLNRMLVRFDSPQDMRGLGILLRERPTFEYDVFVYQPTLKKVRRVSLYQRGDRFFGTDLAFEDLEGKRSEQWDVEFIRTEGLNGREAYVIALVPEGFPSGYERLVVWFDRELPLMLRVEFYRRGELLKTAQMSAEDVVERGGFFVPTRLKFSSGEEFTVLEVSRIEIHEEIPAQRFTTTSLEFGSKTRDARGLR